MNFSVKLDRGSIGTSPMFGIGSPPENLSTPTPTINKLLLDHAELPHVLDLAFHLVNLVGWMIKRDNSKTFGNNTSLLEHSFTVKSYGWGVGWW